MHTLFFSVVSKGNYNGLWGVEIHHLMIANAQGGWSLYALNVTSS